MECEYCHKYFYDAQGIGEYIFHLIIKHPNKYTKVEPGYETGISFTAMEPSY